MCCKSLGDSLGGSHCGHAAQVSFVSSLPRQFAGHTCYAVGGTREGVSEPSPIPRLGCCIGDCCLQSATVFITKTDLNIVTWDPTAPQAEVTAL